MISDIKNGIIRVFVAFYYWGRSSGSLSSLTDVEAALRNLSKNAAMQQQPNV